MNFKDRIARFKFQIYQLHARKTGKMLIYSEHMLLYKLKILHVDSQYIVDITVTRSVTDCNGKPVCSLTPMQAGEFSLPSQLSQSFVI